MNVIRRIGAVLTAIGAILIGIVGIILLAGYEVLDWFYQSSLVVLGVGLLLTSIWVFGKK